KQPQPIGAFVAPASLGQRLLLRRSRRDRSIPGAFAKRRRTGVFLAKEVLIALVNTPDDLLNGLRIKLLPMSEPRHALQLCDMTFQTIVANIALKAPVVPFLDSDQVIVYLGCQVDLGMQIPKPFA